MAGRARFAARSKRPPTTKYRIPVKPGGKIRDWYLSRAAPTSVRPMERAADNSKPAARIASSGINGNSRVATARMTNKSVRHPNVGAASPGPSLIKIGAVRNPFWWLFTWRHTESNQLLATTSLSARTRIRQAGRHRQI